MDLIKGLLAVAGAVIVVSVIGVYGREFALRMDAHYAPREEQVRHDTFDCSASHSDGMVRELRQIRDQYSHADAAGKAALADTFRHEADGVTCYELPADLQSFSNSIR